MGYRAINREAIRLSRTAETHKAEKLFRYNAAHYPSSMTINNLAWFLYLEYPEYDANALIQMFKTAFFLHPNPKSLMAIAQYHFDHEQFLSAETVLHQLPAKYVHTNANALSLLLVTSLNLNKYCEAKKICKKIFHKKELFSSEPEFLLCTQMALWDCEIECGNTERAVKKIIQAIKKYGYNELGYTPLCLLYKTGNYNIVAEESKSTLRTLQAWSPRHDELFILINACARTFGDIDISDFDIFIYSEYKERLLKHIYPIAKNKKNHMHYKFRMPPIYGGNYIDDYL